MITLNTIKRAIDTIAESQCYEFVKVAYIKIMHLTLKNYKLIKLIFLIYSYKEQCWVLS